MKTFKKILKYFLISMAILLSIPILIIWDLEEDYVYYFQHSKETNKEGIPFVLLDHLDKYTTPDFEEDGGFLYDTDGRYSISYEKINTKDNYIFSQTSYQGSYKLLVYSADKSENTQFSYDKYFSLIDIVNYSGIDEEKNININRTKKEEAQEIIAFLTQPLLERVEPPAINLQWLFDELDYWKLERKWMWHWLIE